MKMKLLTAIIAATGFAAAPFAFSSTYQGEVTAAYSDVNPDATSTDAYEAGIQGKYYFSPVDTSQHPLAEAAFLEKASNIYVSAATKEWKGDGFRSDIYAREIGIDFYIPDSIFYLGAGVRENKNQTKFAADPDNGSGEVRFGMPWQSQWFVKAGVSPVDGLLVWSEFVEDVDVSEQWNINGKYVIALAGEKALNFEASYENSDDFFPAETWSAAADFYFDRHLSVGTGFTHETFENDGLIQGKDATDYFIRARNYFTDNIGVELEYTSGEFEDALTLGASIRF
ncbi:putative porin [Cellvibrio sp. pealriver]|uniref:putative porin n=1 Tax=Cellvibrio sp. pealriver TaxID=1622269 RepID=UPI00066FD2B7|nr:putative porin [Cellvibrio sp. pealriver]